ncbi:GPI anchored serine-threonine rich family protein [Patescibacteria group bacterium]|nr:GPI anchored serine-threonine rich family protein [Patescibacteria group bacterium]
MNQSIFDKITAEKGLFFTLVAAIIIVAIVVVYLFITFGSPKIKITSPSGGDKWEIGQKYEITWEAKKVGKVGIALFHEAEVEWIAEDVPAGLGKYEWEVYKGHKYGDGFWVAVFEYPWREDGEVDYSKGSFTITYPISTNCDVLSIENEWPYVASDFPNIRRVFITQEKYKGNLDGLEGANQKCQEQANKAELGGSWIAFLGGDADEDTAVERLKKSERGISGIFVQAEPSAELIQGATCHRLLGKNFTEFLMKFSDPLEINADKISKTFLQNMNGVWLGRVNEASSKNCIVSTTSQVNLNEKYSYTPTCQNWTKAEQFAAGYRDAPLSDFPLCYTPSGSSVRAVSLGGLGSGVSSINTGGYCHRERKLICIED